MAVLYLACVPVGIALWQLAPLVSPSRVEELRLQGGVLAACGFVMIFPYGVAPFLPKRPWAWTTHLVLICLTMTSGACVPLAAPLLIFWLKPETRRFFGRE
jgi:hypothetical protein